MRLIKAAMALGLAVFLAGCNFQSETILTVPLGGGDLIAGFGPSDPVRIKILSGQDEDVATVMPQKQGDGTVRYEIVSGTDGSAPAEANKTYLSAKKLTDERYIIRYTAVDAKAPSKIVDTQLAFLSIRKGEYIYLAHLEDTGILTKVFPVEAGRPRPTSDGDGFVIETLAQAEAISSYFDSHVAEFSKDKDYQRAVIVN